MQLAWEEKTQLTSSRAIVKTGGFTLEHHSSLVVVVERSRARVVDLLEEEE